MSSEYYNVEQVFSGRISHDEVIKALDKIGIKKRPNGKYNTSPTALNVAITVILLDKIDALEDKLQQMEWNIDD